MVIVFGYLPRRVAWQRAVLARKHAVNAVAMHPVQTIVVCSYPHVARMVFQERRYGDVGHLQFLLSVLSRLYDIGAVTVGSQPQVAVAVIIYGTDIAHVLTAVGEERTARVGNGDTRLEVSQVDGALLVGGDAGHVVRGNAAKHDAQMRQVCRHCIASLADENAVMVGGNPYIALAVVEDIAYGI